MLEGWLGPTDLSTFRSTFLQRAPLAHPATVSDPRTLFDWRLLDEVLAADPEPDVRLDLAGALVQVPVPRSVAELRECLRAGIGVCIRRAERTHARLRAVADAFERDLGAAQVQLFVTPARTAGLDGRLDDADVDVDVFIVQTAGITDYSFRAPESSVVQTATLVPGDFLYIPARWWHTARCQRTSLSVSVGVTPRPG